MIVVIINIVTNIIINIIIIINNNNINNCKIQSPSIDKSSSVKFLSVLNIYMIYLNNIY